MTESPTTRETADHAELARIEALLREHIRVDASGLAPAVVSHFVFGFDTAAAALLSEIAALRGELTETRVAADLPVSSVRADLRQAERQRDDAVGLLREAASELESEVEARYDGIKDHPAMTPKYERDMDTPQRIRAFLANQGAE